jgi:hypothetical protein
MTKTIVGCLLAGGMLALVCVLLFVSLFAAILGAVSSVFGQSGNRSCEPTSTPTPIGHHGGAQVIAQATSTVMLTSSGMPGCVPPNQISAEVVALARQMAEALYVNPDCGGIISYPDCYYTWYDSSFPQSVIAYGNEVCPGCYAWANGTYQCVSFVRGAYGPIYPMVWTANAFDLYALYAGKPGWQEIPSAAAPSSERGMPLPGDVMVFKDSSIGHVAIVTSAVPPRNGTNGSITFANANSVSPSTTMPLLPDLTVDTSSWPGYTVWGYIRPALR